MNEQNQPLSNQHYSLSPPSHHNNSGEDVELRELFKALWDDKSTVVFFTVIFSLGALIYAFYKPNIFQVSASFQIEESVYSVAKEYEPRVSREFIMSDVFKEKLIQEIDTDSKELVGINIRYDIRKGFFTIYEISTEPQVAYSNVSKAIEKLNDIVKNEELKKVDSSLEELSLLIDRDIPNAIQQHLDELFALQIYKKAMLESSSATIVRLVSKPVKPTAPISPNRKFFVVLGFLLGASLGVIFVLCRFVFLREKSRASKPQQT